MKVVGETSSGPLLSCSNYALVVKSGSMQGGHMYCKGVYSENMIKRAET